MQREQFKKAVANREEYHELLAAEQKKKKAEDAEKAAQEKNKSLEKKHYHFTFIPDLSRHYLYYNLDLKDKANDVSQNLESILNQGEALHEIINIDCGSIENHTYHIGQSDMRNQNLDVMISWKNKDYREEQDQAETTKNRKEILVFFYENPEIANIKAEWLLALAELWDKAANEIQKQKSALSKERDISQSLSELLSTLQNEFLTLRNQTKRTKSYASLFPVIRLKLVAVEQQIDGVIGDLNEAAKTLREEAKNLQNQHTHLQTLCDFPLERDIIVVTPKKIYGKDKDLNDLVGSESGQKIKMVLPNKKEDAPNAPHQTILQMIKLETKLEDYLEKREQEGNYLHYINFFCFSKRGLGISKAAKIAAAQCLKGVIAGESPKLLEQHLAALQQGRLSKTYKLYCSMAGVDPKHPTQYLPYFHGATDLRSVFARVRF